MEFRRNFFTEVHQHRGTSPPFPEQELLDCVSDGDGEPLDSLEERCKVVLENLWRFTFVLGRLWFLIQTRFQLGDQRNFLRNSTHNALPGVEAPVKLDDSFPSTIFIGCAKSLQGEVRQAFQCSLQTDQQVPWRKISGTISSIHFGACSFVKCNVRV